MKSDPLPSQTTKQLPSETHVGLGLMEDAGQYPQHYHQTKAESPSPTEARNHHLRPHDHHHAEAEAESTLLQPPNHPFPEWLSLIMSFCFAGISIGSQSIQRPSNHIPMSIHMAGLGVVFALASFVVSRYIPGYLRREAKFLENTGVFFGVTAFFLDITLSFPLCLKIISWIIYAAALLAILLSRYFHFISVHLAN